MVEGGGSEDAPMVGGGGSRNATMVGGGGCRNAAMVGDEGSDCALMVEGGGYECALMVGSLYSSAGAAMVGGWGSGFARFATPFFSAFFTAFCVDSSLLLQRHASRTFQIICPPFCIFGFMCHNATPCHFFCSLGTFHLPVVLPSSPSPLHLLPF